MGDNAEFEKLTVLEARLAAALDRIAVGLGEHQDAPPQEDPGLTSAALEDAQIRADRAEMQVAEQQQRIAALEAQVSAAAEAPAVSEETMQALEAERDGLAQRVAALESARQADADEAARMKADNDAMAQSLADANAKLLQMSVAPPADQSAQDVEDLRDQISDLTARVHRLRAERDEARAAAESRAQPQADESGAAELRAEADRLRIANEELLATVSELRAAVQDGSGDVNSALVVELSALKAARASEAAELQRILDEIERDTAPAAGGDHA